MLATPASTAARAPSSPWAWQSTGRPSAAASSTMARSWDSLKTCFRGSVSGSPARSVARVFTARTPLSAFTRTSSRRSSSVASSAGRSKRLSDASRASPRFGVTKTPAPR